MDFVISKQHRLKLFQYKVSLQTLSNASNRKRPKFYEVFLFDIFILHSRESELCRYISDGTCVLAGELPFLRCLNRLSFT